MKRNISDAWLRGLHAPERGRLEVVDTQAPGLLLRVTPNGSFSWSARWKLPSGKYARVSLGRWPETGISAARKQAAAARVGLQSGDDPAEAKRVARAEARAKAALPTVAEAAERWRGAKAAEWSPAHAASVERVVRIGLLPMLGKCRIAELTRAELLAALDAARPRGAGAVALLFRVLSSFIGWAEVSALIPANPLPRKAQGVLAPPVKARSRVLTDDELAALWSASERLSLKGRAFVRLLALTGTRRSETAGISVGEVSRDECRWVIPSQRAKNRIERSVALGPLALAELAAIWPDSGASRLLGRGGSALSGFSKLKARLDRLVPLPAWDWHDLRRTCRTGLARLGVDDATAEAAIGHISGRSALVKVYDQHKREAEAAVALLKWQRHVQSLVALETTTADVVPFRGAA